MKPVNKLIAFFIATTLTSAPLNAFALSSSDIDYSSQLAQIESLMQQCDEAGISYAYEAINYKTIERFEEYIKQDITEGVATDAMNTYNKSEVDALCTETINNLTAYINGTKTSKDVAMPDMSKVTADGEGGLSDGVKPVIAMGYGSTIGVADDMENLNGFGADIIQIEAGPNRMQSFTSPFTAEAVGDASYEESFDMGNVYNGGYSLRYVNYSPASGNLYVRPNLTVKCKPNTTYNYGAYTYYYSPAYTQGLNLEMRTNWGGEAGDVVRIKNASGSGSAFEGWTLYQNSFTTAADQTELELFFVIEGEVNIWLDNIFISESGSSDNLVANGDLDGCGVNAAFTAIRHNNVDASMCISRDAKHGGESSLKVVNNTPASANVYIQPYQNVPCRPNTTYEFGGWVKYSTSHTNGANISIRTGWTGQTAIGVYSRSGALSSSCDWESYSQTFTTGANQTSFDFFMVVEGEATVYFDDMYVQEAGSSHNMLINGNCEDNALTGDMFQIMKALEKGRQYNVAVSLLLSPHYMPSNITNLPIDTSLLTFIQYNINEENAKRVIERYIDQIMPRITGYSSLSDICLANEVSFRSESYVDFYQPLFQDWVVTKHGSVSGVNSAWGTSYSSKSAIPMPQPMTYTRESNITNSMYDYVVFNQEILRDWQIWLRGLVREYTDLPIHTKALNANIRWDTEYYKRDDFANGSDIEMFDEFSDYAGMDTIDVINDGPSYWNAMMYYDYLYSVTGKPIFNSEAHTIGDGYQTYNEKVADHTNNHLWMASMRGGSLYTHWIWAHTFNSSLVSGNSLLTRPAVVAGIGKTGLDLTRLSHIVKQMRDGGSGIKRVALFYSKPTRCYNIWHMYTNYRVYQALVNAGVKVGFVSEDSLDKLSGYDALILADVTCGTTTARDAVKSFASGGGKVLALNKSGTPFARTQYNRSQTGLSSGTNITIKSVSFSRQGSYSYSASDTIVSNVNSFLSSNGLLTVTVKDSNGNAVTGLDWTYYYDGDTLIINAANVDNDTYGTAKNVKFYLNGTQLTGMKELRSGNTGISTVSLDVYKPQLLVYGTEPAAPTPTPEPTPTPTPTPDPISASLTATASKTSSGSVSCSVTAANTSAYAAPCDVKVEVVNSSGRVIAYHYESLTLAVGRSTRFNISFPNCSAAVSAKITAYRKGTDESIADAVNISF